MLPEKLSNDLCSLKSGQVRPALVVKIKLSSQGQKLSHSFSRCLIKCAANLSYEEVFRIANNTSEDYLQPYKTMLKSLFDAYHAVKIESKKRSPLNLDMPEYKIHLDDTGRVTNISIKQSLFTHNLIEEFMVLANVCAAQTLEDKKSPVIYRIHEVPSKEKTVMLKEVLSEMGFSFAKGQVLKPMAFNKILEKAEQSEFKDLIHKMVLRCQAQAVYHTENEGHFGLNLARYAHFTSPIRRYADLFVHRALVSALDLGGTGLSEFDMQNAAIIADYISKTERKAMQVEMETKDRYYAQFMQDKVGLMFNAVVSGVSSAGLFIKIPEYGAEGLIPIGSLSYGQKRYFILEQEKNMLVDKRSGDYYVLGQTLSARLSEVTPITGGMRFDLTDDSHIIENKRKSEKKQRTKKENTRVKNKKKSVS
jgi:ribonuclease R